MNEKEFRRMVVRIIEEAGGHISMVESPETSPGIPDLNWCLRGREGWTELKVSKAGESPDIRPAQRAWIRRRVVVGGNVSLLLYNNVDQAIITLQGESLEDVKTLKDWYEHGHRITIEEMRDAYCNNPIMEH